MNSYGMPPMTDLDYDFRNIFEFVFVKYYFGGWVDTSELAFSV